VALVEMKTVALFILRLAERERERERDVKLSTEVKMD
jgi:hypothetical protein